MKRKTVLFLLCVTVTISLIGCDGRQQAEKKEKKTQVTVEQTVSDDTKASDEKDNEEAKQEQKQESSEVDKDESIITAQKEEAKQDRQNSTTKKEQTTGQSQNQKTQQPTTPTTPTPETPRVEEETPVPEVPKATASDSVAVANKVIEYINSYRSSPATKLPGLTKYAEYRSRQLISNFAHDTFDERGGGNSTSIWCLYRPDTIWYDRRTIL